ncbi:virulence protein RhuM/Fic/DOC family protein [Paraglaciecola sp.]|uniref:virulence protein RhuM/Fic/DOC family protein n=1 Tax=Paraglaciecola sp. TaxID=1920173 RepID=UPI0030F4A78F
MDDLQIYQSEDGALELGVVFQDDTVWLSQTQLCTLFGRERTVITKHVNNIFKDEELERESVSAKFAHTADDGKTYQVQHYNLDVIISVGYRVKSQQGVKFRQWATRTLKQHLLAGYTLNQKRLSQNAVELQKALELVTRAAALPQHNEIGAGLVDIIAKYTNTFLWLQQYDEGLLTSPTGQTGGTLTALSSIKRALEELKATLINKGEATNLFAQERDNGLSAIWGALEQTVFGEEAYPSIESKAAHLLYFVVKNHPFVDGNKRSAAFLFVDFLNRNDRLLNSHYEPVINDTGLAAITLLVAESNPKEKDTVVRLIENLLSHQKTK